MELQIQIPAILSGLIFLAVAVFQVLLFAGVPLGEYSWGGANKGVLPVRLRIASLLSACLLVCMAFVVAVHANVLFVDLPLLSNKIAVWIITIFMGLNTLGNLASKSSKEKRLMTPLTGVAFFSCLAISIL
jgi:hypothetical protein